MKRSLPLLVVVLALLPPAAQAQVAPEKAPPTFKVADGLELSLWAAEPSVINPTCLDVDSRGPPTHPTRFVLQGGEGRIANPSYGG